MTASAPSPGLGPSGGPGGGLRAVIVTCSDSAAAGQAVDESGPLAAELIGALGHEVVEVVIVPDSAPAIGRSVQEAIAAGARIVVTTGGTGAGPRDVTPEALRGAGLRELPGLGEAIRAASRQQVPAADLSRALGGVLDGAVVLALPGSPGGVRDGLVAVGGLLAHAAGMAVGGGHGGSRAVPTDARAVPADARAVPAGSADLPAGSADLPAGSAAPSGPSPAGDALAPTEHLVRSAPITEAEVAAEVAEMAAGAVVTFAGRVRDHDGGRAVAALHYEGHPDAGRVLAEVLVEARDRPGVLAAAARHRVGDLALGELAFAAAVSAAHRREAFEACAWLVDEAKARLPIWKHQRFTDGTDEWVNCP